MDFKYKAAETGNAQVKYHKIALEIGIWFEYMCSLCTLHCDE